MTIGVKQNQLLIRVNPVISGKKKTAWRFNNYLSPPSLTRTCQLPKLLGTIMTEIIKYDLDLIRSCRNHLIIIFCINTYLKYNSNLISIFKDFHCKTKKKTKTKSIKPLNKLAQYIVDIKQYKPSYMYHCLGAFLNRRG